MNDVQKISPSLFFFYLESFWCVYATTHRRKLAVLSVSPDLESGCDRDSTSTTPQHSTRSSKNCVRPCAVSANTRGLFTPTSCCRSILWDLLQVFFVQTGDWLRACSWVNAVYRRASGDTKTAKAVAKWSSKSTCLCCRYLQLVRQSTLTTHQGCQKYFGTINIDGVDRKVKYEVWIKQLRPRGIEYVWFVSRSHNAKKKKICYKS